MTPKEPERVTIEEKVEEIYRRMKTVWLDGDMIEIDEQLRLEKEDKDLITSHLTQACAEAVDSHNATRDQRRDIEQYEKGFSEGFELAKTRAAKVVEDRMEQNEIAADLYTLPENKLARKVQAWMFDVAERIRALRPGEK